MANQTFQRTEVYKDFDINFQMNPLTGDISTKKDANAINQSLKNLVNTNFYERPFQPEVGCNIRAILFQPADPITIVDLRQAINQTIKNYEPRVNVISILVEDKSDYNAYNVKLVYNTVVEREPREFDFILERLR